jgi:hypothetical protein
MSDRTSNKIAFRIAEMAFKCAVDGEYDTAAELLSAAGSVALRDPLKHHPHKPDWMYVLAEAADRMRQEQLAQDTREKIVIAAKAQT